MNNAGFVKLHRKITKWDWYKDADTKEVFLHLLLTANFTEEEHGGVKIPVGSRVVKQREFAEEIGSTYQKVRTAIKKLSETGEITVDTSNKTFSVVSITNWKKYQLDSRKKPDDKPKEKEAEQKENNAEEIDERIPSSLRQHFTKYEDFLRWRNQ